MVRRDMGQRVFQMTDALGAGDYEGALKKLQVLYQMQTMERYCPASSRTKGSPVCVRK